MGKYWRIILARAPLPMLALAASYGVYSYATLFVPEWVAIVQAAAFEATYLGLAVVTVDSQQRRRAALISVGAVLASIIYNSLSGWFHRAPYLLDGASDVAWLALAALHGAPLAWVAYLVASLLLHSDAPDAPLKHHDAPVGATVTEVSPPALSGGAMADSLPDDRDARLTIALDLVRQGLKPKAAAAWCDVSESTLRRRLVKGGME